MDRLSLAIVWYLVNLTESNGDGKHVGYLVKNQAKYRGCDDELLCELRRLLIDPQGNVIVQNRRVDIIRSSNIFPKDTIFYEANLHLAGVTATERARSRQAWLELALKQTERAEVVFLDPDNGIECQSASATAPKTGPKYTLWNEIQEFVKRGQSVLVYHHLCRSGPHPEQVRALCEQFGRKLPNGFTTRALIFKRGTPRAYFIGMALKHKSRLDSQLSGFMATNWRRHFDQVTCPHPNTL